MVTHFHNDHANGAARLLERMEVGLLALPDVDQESPIRFSHENPTIQTLYQEYLGHPLSETAHHLLHTDQRKWTL